MGVCSSKGSKVFKPSALLILDAQNDFLKGGSLQIQGGEQIVAEIKNLKNKVEFTSVIYTRDWHPSDHISFISNNEGNEGETVELFKKIKLPDGRNQLMWPVHCVQTTHGAEFPANLDFKEDDLLISKGTNTVVDSESAFGTYPEVTDLEKVLNMKAVTRIFIVGFPLEYTASNTAIDAANKGLDTYIVEDLVGCLKDEKKLSCLETLRAKGVKIIHSSKVRTLFPK